MEAAVQLVPQAQRSVVDDGRRWRRGAVTRRVASVFGPGVVKRALRLVLLRTRCRPATAATCLAFLARLAATLLRLLPDLRGRRCVPKPVRGKGVAQRHLLDRESWVDAATDCTV